MPALNFDDQGQKILQQHPKRALEFARCRVMKLLGRPPPPAPVYLGVPMCQPGGRVLISRPVLRETLTV